MNILKMILVLVILSATIAVAGWLTIVPNLSEDKQSGFDVGQTLDGGYIVYSVLDLSIGTDLQFGSDSIAITKINDMGEVISTVNYLYKDRGFLFGGTGYFIYENDSILAFARGDRDTLHIVDINQDCDVIRMISNNTPSSLQYHYPAKFVRSSTRDYLLIETTWDSVSLDKQMHLTKLDSNGTVLWTKEYGDDSVPEYGREIIENSVDGSYVIFGNNNSELKIVAIDSIGDSLWDNSVDIETDIDFDITGGLVYEVVESSDGYYIAISDRVRSLVIKTDSSGDTVWTKELHLDSLFQITSATSKDDSSFYVTGLKSSGSPFSSIVFIMKIDNSGNISWSHEYEHLQWPFSIDTTSDHGFILTGMTKEKEVFVLKTDSLGRLNIKEPSMVPDEVNISIFPNSFNSSVYISSPEETTVEIFDVLGQSIDKLPGGDQVWRPEASVGSGLFFVRARVGDNSITKRVVYLK